MTFRDAAQVAGQGIARAPDSFLALIARLPSTNFRIFATLVMAGWTCGHYMTSGTWKPSVEWLAFLVTMSGLDVAQFHSKRKTEYESDRPSGAIPQPPEAK